LGVIAPNARRGYGDRDVFDHPQKENAISGMGSTSHLSSSQFEKGFWVEYLMSLYVAFLILALFCVNTWSLVD